MNVLTQGEGLMLIIIFFMIMTIALLFIKGKKQTKEEFLVAGHSAPWLLTAFSMAATWVWAPSMFTAAEKAYTQGFAGVFWFVVPNVLTFVLFAFFAAGAGLDISDTQLVNVGAVIAFAPKWFLYLFFLLILSGLISTVDSILCAVSSVAGHDIVMRISEMYGPKSIGAIKIGRRILSSVDIARIAMVIVAILAIGVANIPGIQITYLFLFYGTLRSSVMLPTIFAIKGYKMSESGLYYGIIASLCIGLPIFAIGNLNGWVPLIVAGSLLTIGLSGIISLIKKDC